MPESEMPGAARGQEGEEMTMQSGRELDAKVAEEVFGWHKLAGLLRPLWLFDPQFIEIEGGLEKWCSDHALTVYSGTDVPNFSGPRYSTSWEAMRLVVERMRELEYFIEMVVRVRSYLVCMKRIGGTPMRYYAEGESLPCAVCLAALAAIEGESK